MVAYRQASSDNYAVTGNHSTGVRTTQEATNVGLPGPDAGQGGKSPEASYISDTVFEVDGGMSAA
jgi:hypothetical protein